VGIKTFVPSLRVYSFLVDMRGGGRCKETGMHLDLGPGKKNSRRRCLVYPFNKEFAATTGHAGLRSHEEVKEQALEALRQRSQGKKDV